MARPAVWMLCPDDHLISFDTLDEGEAWLQRHLADIEHYKTTPVAEADDAESL